MQRWRREQESEFAGIETRFREQSRKDGVSGEFRAADGPFGPTVALQARYSDLVIVGQRNPDVPSPFGGVDIVPEVLFAAGRPLLVVPYALPLESTCGKAVLVGWNGTREAARAIHDAIPLLKGAGLVTVLSINPRRGIAAENGMPAADMARHLARHGIEVRAAHSVADDITVGDALLSYASDIGADMLVIGGYGHSRVRELMLGGVTELLLRTMTLPVLVSH